MLIACAAAFVSISRVSDNKHHFSDVIAGDVLGFVVAILIVSTYVALSGVLVTKIKWYNLLWPEGHLKIHLKLHLLTEIDTSNALIHSGAMSVSRNLHDKKAYKERNKEVKEHAGKPKNKISPA